MFTTAANDKVACMSGDMNTQKWYVAIKCDRLPSLIDAVSSFFVIVYNLVAEEMVS